MSINGKYAAKSEIKSGPLNKKYCLKNSTQCQTDTYSILGKKMLWMHSLSDVSMEREQGPDTKQRRRDIFWQWLWIGAPRKAMSHVTRKDDTTWIHKERDSEVLRWWCNEDREHMGWVAEVVIT